MAESIFRGPAEPWYYDLCVFSIEEAPISDKRTKAAKYKKDSDLGTSSGIELELFSYPRKLFPVLSRAGSRGASKKRKGCGIWKNRKQVGLNKKQKPY